MHPAFPDGFTITLNYRKGSKEGDSYHTIVVVVFSIGLTGGTEMETSMGFPTIVMHTKPSQKNPVISEISHISEISLFKIIFFICSTKIT